MSCTFIYEEINRYIMLDAEDAVRAKKIAPIVMRNFETIADNVYQQMEEDPRTFSAFQSRNQLEKHREILREWMEEAFSGVYDQAYFESRLLNGQRHAVVSLFPHFIFGKMALIRKQLVDTIAVEDLEPIEMASYIDTINRIIDLDLAIIIQSYWDTLMVSKLKVPLALSSGLAHEIRNPLNGIALNLSLLDRKLKRAPEVAEGTTSVLDAIRTELHRINSLTTEIMNFAKPMIVDLDYVSSRELIDEVMRLQKEALKANEIKFETTWNGPEEIFADHDRLFQVMLNLIGNGIEALEHKEGEKRLSITIDNRKGATTAIKITDNGCGMEPEVQERIFDLYYTTKSTGTGLGMAIVQKIVEAHSGMIRVSSRRGEGTTIDIYLPRPVVSNEVRKVAAN